jgi:DNA replication protein DnaC
MSVEVKEDVQELENKIIQKSKKENIGRLLSSNLPEKNKWIFSRNNFFDENTTNNILIYGPSGFGKTTVATEYCYSIINQETDRK